MIILLGASGYVGEAFARELKRRGREFAPLTRTSVNYSNFRVLVDYLKGCKPEFLINAAGYTGRPNVDACESARAATVQGNALFPLTVSHACTIAGVPWGHVSSGCIYAGAKVLEKGEFRVEKDLMTSEMIRVRRQHPDALTGFLENDAPNFTFDDPPCSFYSGTKALAEAALTAEQGSIYIWRLRIPFDEFDHPRNYLTKIQTYAKVYENVNSLSHRYDFVKACLDCWEKRIPFGIYNMTNPGFITTSRVVELMKKTLRLERSFEFWADEQEFQRAVKAPRSNCVLDASKLLAAGVHYRPVEEAVVDALKQWKPSLCDR